MNTILTRSLLPAFALAAMLTASFSSIANAATVDFTAPLSTDYADNFDQLSSGTFFSQQNGYVQGQQSSTFKGSTLYDSAPLSAESVSLTATITGTLGNSPSLFLFSRVDDTGVGFAARVLLLSSSNLRIMLYYGHNVVDLTGGTTLLDWEHDATAGGGGFYRAGDNVTGASGTAGHTLASGATYQLYLESTSDHQFRFEVRDADGDLIVTSGFQTSANLQEAIETYGQVGFGGYAANGAGNTLRFYEFSASGIPEPSTYALLIGSASLLIATSRLRRKTKGA